MDSQANDGICSMPDNAQLSDVFNTEVANPERRAARHLRSRCQP